MPPEEQLHFHIRCPKKFGRAFDKLWKQSGFQSRQDCLHHLMRGFINEEGPKQVKLINEQLKTK